MNRRGFVPGSVGCRAWSCSPLDAVAAFLEPRPGAPQRRSPGGTNACVGRISSLCHPERSPLRPGSPTTGLCRCDGGADAVEGPAVRDVDFCNEPQLLPHPPRPKTCRSTPATKNCRWAPRCIKKSGGVNGVALCRADGEAH